MNKAGNKMHTDRFSYKEYIGYASTILVFIMGISGCDVSPFQEISQPPVLISPAESSVHESSDITYTWSNVQGAQQYTLYIDSNAIPATDYTFDEDGNITMRASDYVLEGAEHTWHIEASTQLQQAVSDSNTFYLLQQGQSLFPQLQFSSPLSGSVVSGETPLEGTASSYYGIAYISIKINNETPIEIEGLENWNGLINTAEYNDGLFTIVAKIADHAGHTNSDSLSLYFDNTPPSILIEDPIDGSWVPQTFTITGIANDNIKLKNVQISIDGSDPIAAQMETTSWELELTNPLTAGSHNITATAYDQVNQTKQYTITVQVDTSAPNLNITSHTTGPYPPSVPDVVTGTITLEGTSSDAQSNVDGVYVKVGGGSYTKANPIGASPNIWSTWEYDIDTTTLLDAQYTLYIQAINTAGGISNEQIIIEVNNAPEIVISTPENYDKFSAQADYCDGDCQISGQAMASGVIGLTITDIDLRFKENAGIWSGWIAASNSDTGSQTSNWSHQLDTTSYEDGTLYIEARATNSLGKTVIDSVQVYIDNNIPQVNLNSPLQDSVILDTISMIGTATDIPPAPPLGEGKIITVTLFLDGTYIGNASTANDFADWNLNLDTTLYANGQHTLQAVATDWYNFTSMLSEKDVIIFNEAGLIAYYPFNGDMQDESGNGYDATAFNGPSPTQNRFGENGRAYSFDGVDDRVQLPPEVLDGLVTISASFWIKTNDNTFAVLSGANFGEFNEFLYYHNGGLGGPFDIYIHGPGQTMTNDPYTDDVWHHIVIITNAIQTTIYIDNGFAGTTPNGTGAGIDIDGLWLAAEQDAVNGGFTEFQQLNGELDDIRFYDRELTPAEIDYLYNLVE